MVVALSLFEGGCGSSGTKVPDAGGADAAPDAGGADAVPDRPATDMGASSDVAPADDASDSGAGDASQGDRAGDSMGDPCRPPCWSKLLNGCVPEGDCIYSMPIVCYANGVKFITSPAGNPIAQTITKNGVVCVTVDRANNYSDPSGNVLGYLIPNADNSVTITCTGEAPVTIPASCTISCRSGTCPP
jgi:hypothetical protein